MRGIVACLVLAQRLPACNTTCDAGCQMSPSIQDCSGPLLTPPLCVPPCRLCCSQGYQSGGGGRRNAAGAAGPASDLEAGAVVGKYMQQYEQSINPFADFKAKEREARRKQLPIQARRSRCGRLAAAARHSRGARSRQPVAQLALCSLGQPPGPTPLPPHTHMRPRAHTHTHTHTCADPARRTRPCMRWAT